MHIADVNITPVAISDPPLLNAAGLHAPYALRIIVELVTNDGISGWGEIPGKLTTLNALNDIADRLIGKDPFQLNAIFADISQLVDPESDHRGAAPWDHRTWVHVQSALEVACFDVMGKATGRPVVDLLGGKSRDAVPFSAYLFYKHEGAGGELEFGTDQDATGWDAARQKAALDPNGVVAEAQAMCNHYGFKSIKLKGGVFPPDEEVAAMLALQEAFGENVPLRLDPNAIWKVETAIEVGKQLEGVLEYFEDPVRGQEAMGQVAQVIKIPLATNMCTTSFDDLPGSVKYNSEAIILTDHHYWGGFRPLIALGEFCKVFERGLSMHSNSHLGISLAAMTAIAGAIPNLTYACDTHFPWQYEDVLVKPLTFEDGSIAVSSEPGLGIEVDRDALAKLHQQYIKCGLTERNDEVEMQKVKPGWTFQKTRW